MTPWFVNIDGSGLEQLLNVDGDVPAGWSPDGSKLTFTRNGGPKRQIFVMNADGTGIHQLTTGNFNSSGGTWSPDGTRLAFTSDRDGTPSSIR